MANASVLNLNESNFDHEVLNATTPVLVDFWAAWCGPCKMIAPILDEIAIEKTGKVKICKVDVEENQAISARFGVHVLPTLLLFKNGEVQEQIVGGRTSKSDLIGKIEALG